MRRVDVIQTILDTVPDDALIVSTLGLTARELCQLDDSPRNFYMLGSMGLATSIGLGLALNTNRQIVVIEGDGSILMNLGTIETIQREYLPNLLTIVVRNFAHETTGGQILTWSYLPPTNWELASEERLRDSLHNYFGCCDYAKEVVHFLVVPCHLGHDDPPLVPLEPHEIARRFREHVLGSNDGQTTRKSRMDG